MPFRGVTRGIPVMWQPFGKYTLVSNSMRSASPALPTVPCAWLPATLLPASCCRLHPLQPSASAVLQPLPLALCTAGTSLWPECCPLQEGDEVSYRTLRPCALLRKQPRWKHAVVSDTSSCFCRDPVCTENGKGIYKTCEPQDQDKLKITYH